MAHGHTEPGDFNRLVPEQRRGGRSESVPLNAQTDMWAAGIIIWEMATGSHNPFQGSFQDYVDWHQRQPRDPQGRIDIAETLSDSAWGGRVRALEEGTASQASMPGLANVLVNDLNHPDPAQRADATELMLRLRAAWSMVAPALEARRDDLMLSTATAQRGAQSKAWWSTRNLVVDPEAGFTTP